MGADGGVCWVKLKDGFNKEEDNDIQKNFSFLVSRFGFSWHENSNYDEYNDEFLNNWDQEGHFYFGTYNCGYYSESNVRNSLEEIFYILKNEYEDSYHCLEYIKKYPTFKDMIFEISTNPLFMKNNFYGSRPHIYYNSHPLISVANMLIDEFGFYMLREDFSFLNRNCNSILNWKILSWYKAINELCYTNTFDSEETWT